MISLKDIRYVRLGTANLDDAVRYATQILGLELVRRDRGNAYLRADDRDHTLAYTAGNPRDQSVAFEIGSVRELEAAAAELDKYRDALCAALPWYRRLLRLPSKLRRRLSLSVANRQDILNEKGLVPPGNRLNEDCFWSFKAADYYPGFKIASVSDGLSFSFEAAPRRCFERNVDHLPFGCHAWGKYDRKFWEPFLLK